MDKKLLLDSISILSSSRVGISAFRSLLNSLAIRGRIDTNCSSDCNIDNLISELEICKSRFLEQTGKVVKKKISGYETPTLGFDLPSNWDLVSLDKLCFAQAGFAFSAGSFNSDGKGLPLIRIRDIDRGFSETFYSGEYRPEFLVQKGDWLIGMDGNFNVRQWKGESALLNQRVTRLIFFDDRINQKFISLALEEHLHSLMGTKSYTTVDHLSTKQIESAPIPLPCIEEQNQIIFHLDELVNQIAKIDEYQESMRRLSLAARKSAVDAISTAQSQKEFEIAWNRIQLNWEVIAGTPDAINSLRKLILSLAARGKLVNSPDRFAGTVATLELSEVCKVSWGNLSLTKSSYIENGPYLAVSAAGPDGRIGIAENKAFTPVLSAIGARCGTMFMPKEDFTAIKNTMTLQPDSKLLDNWYLLYVMMGSNLPRRGSAQPFMSKSDIEKFRIRVPSLEEQKLIANNVEDLLQKCDLLEAKLRDGHKLAEKFSRSVVSASA
jgi:restriction endonuclease S subunit